MKVLQTYMDEPGWVIPEYLRKRWDLRLGKSSELLPDLLVEVKEVDIFLHDSEHSYENMYLKMEIALNSKYLPKIP